ncbi:mobile mystery protein B [Psychromonas sp. Urea-02u-13]|uniref:mobile mystery protein B n=1 Tax=Psychromonas sp. Urea-02u-13 TaxID=2058326 RepID=UPI000C3475A4|nr:mobile mystery protein B [Psychromonas sp. Urea-02u-13]PKG38948.1 mobile mystery protein B [Psychromonas sp. Urea-02u-13]
MNLLIDDPEGATPLSPDDLQGLKLPHIQIRAQLNEVEAANILQGQLWVSNLNALTLDDIFSRDFITALHESLFGDIWAWAGTFRVRELNIGVDPKNISVDLHNFLEDAKCWLEFKHFSDLELSARIQHRLVQIHPFPNGNGRHSRIFTDVVRVFLLHKKPLKWANVKLEDISKERGAYISGLRKADAGDFSEMVHYLDRLGNE